MIKEIRKVRNKKKAANIRTLQFTGKINAYEKDGYAAYDTDEYATYKSGARVGRPLKKGERRASNLGEKNKQ